MKDNAFVLILLLFSITVAGQTSADALEGKFRSTDGLYTFEAYNAYGALEGRIHDIRIDYPHPTTIQSLGNGRYTGNARINGYNYYWSGSLVDDALTIDMGNYTYSFKRLAEETPQATTDWDANGPPPNTTTKVSNMEVAEVEQLLLGARITSYTSTSIFSSASGSTLKTTNLCSNGKLYQDSDGSFYVEGSIPEGRSAGDMAAGAHKYSGAGGDWYIGDHQGQPSLILKFQDGSWDAHPLNLLANGSWQWGRTKYAIELGKAKCP